MIVHKIDQDHQGKLFEFAGPEVLHEPSIPPQPIAEANRTRAAVSKIVEAETLRTDSVTRTQLPDPARTERLQDTSGFITSAAEAEGRERDPIPRSQGVLFKDIDRGEAIKREQQGRPAKDGFYHNKDGSINHGRLTAQERRMSQSIPASEWMFK